MNKSFFLKALPRLPAIALAKASKGGGNKLQAPILLDVSKSCGQCRSMKLLRKIILAIVLFMPIICFANSLSAKVDRTQINQGETFTLSLTLTGSASGGNISLQALNKDFQIFGTSKSSQLSIINGKSTAQTRWEITLFPKNPGQLTIPTLKLDDLKTTPIQLQVNKAKPEQKLISKHANQDIFFVTDINPKQVYPQAQAVYTFKLYFDTDIQNASIQSPTADNAELKPLGDLVRYSSSHDGHPYQVLEHHFAVLPQTAGKVVIHPPVLTGTILDMNAVNNMQNRMDAFFDPVGKPIHLEGHPITLKVKSKPANILVQDWLPAKNITLSETWQNAGANASLDTPITRTINIHGAGISAQQLPNLNDFNIPGVKVYVDKPVNKESLTPEGINASRTIKIAMIPEHAGTYHIPALKISWWNTTTNHAEVSRLPARTIEVHGSGQTNAMPIGINNSVIKDNKAASKKPTAVTHKNLLSTPWLIAGVLFVLWIVTLCLLLSKNKNKQHDSPLKLNQIKKALANACANHDAKRTQTLLIEWAKLQWPKQNIHNLGDIINIITDDALIAELKNLDAYLYQASNSEHCWHGKALWENLALYINQQENNKSAGNKDSDGLPPLSPQ